MFFNFADRNYLVITLTFIRARAALSWWDWYLRGEPEPGQQSSSEEKRKHQSFLGWSRYVLCWHLQQILSKYFISKLWALTRHTAAHPGAPTFLWESTPAGGKRRQTKASWGETSREKQVRSLPTSLPPLSSVGILKSCWVLSQQLNLESCFKTW